MIWVMMAADSQPSITSNSVLIAIVVGVLSAPFLNFLISLTRAKVDKNNVIVTGGGQAVTTMSVTMKELREELTRVKGELRETREENAACVQKQDEQDERHAAELAQVRAEARAEVNQIRMEHRLEMVEIRSERDDYKRLVRRLRDKGLLSDEET